MAIAATVPVIWGLATHRVTEASWITIAAECICWAELKGAFAQRLRLLLGAAFLALLFAVLGSMTGNNIWLSVLAMLVVGFTAGLFKNLGDRGSGLAVCVQVMFVLTNAYPTENILALEQRLQLVLIGGGWTILTGIAASAFIPSQQPYRRTIALVWRANANLAASIACGWDRQAVSCSIHIIYQ